MVGATTGDCQLRLPGRPLASQRSGQLASFAGKLGCWLRSSELLAAATTCHWRPKSRFGGLGCDRFNQNSSRERSDVLHQASFQNKAGCWVVDTEVDDLWVISMHQNGSGVYSRRLFRLFIFEGVFERRDARCVESPAVSSKKDSRRAVARGAFCCLCCIVGDDVAFAANSLVFDRSVHGRPLAASLRIAPICFDQRIKKPLSKKNQKKNQTIAS